MVQVEENFFRSWGGGFLLMYIKQRFRGNFFKKFPNLINVPFNFTNEGSKIIFKNLDR